MPQSSFQYELSNTGKKIQKILSIISPKSQTKSKSYSIIKKRFCEKDPFFFLEITTLEIWVGSVNCLFLFLNPNTK